MNKSLGTLIHVGDRERDERMRMQMSAKWQPSSMVEGKRGGSGTMVQ